MLTTYYRIDNFCNCGLWSDPFTSEYWKLAKLEKQTWVIISENMSNMPISNKTNYYTACITARSCSPTFSTVYQDFDHCLRTWFEYVRLLHCYCFIAVSILHKRQLFKQIVDEFSFTSHCWEHLIICIVLSPKIHPTYCREAKLFVTCMLCSSALSLYWGSPVHSSSRNFLCGECGRWLGYTAGLLVCWGRPLTWWSGQTHWSLVLEDRESQTLSQNWG